MSDPIAAAAVGSYSDAMGQILNTDRLVPVDTAFEGEMARLLVSALQLEVAPDEIEPDAALFGEGLGLDSIDALELSMAVARDYGVELKSEQAREQQIFASLRALSRYVAAHRTK